MAENVKTSKLVTFRKNTGKFFKEIRSELKKVVWPSRAQLIKNTITVLAACLIIGILIWIVDFGLSKLSGAIFG